MKESRKRRTPEEFVAAMEHLLNTPPETPEEVDAFLRSEGLDPATIAGDGWRVVFRAAMVRAQRAEERAERAEAAVVALREALAQIEQGAGGNAGRCMDCDAVAALAAQTLARSVYKHGTGGHMAIIRDILAVIGALTVMCGLGLVLGLLLEHPAIVQDAPPDLDLD